MAPEYPTAVCIEAETDGTAHRETVDHLRRGGRLLIYGALWLAFTLSGVFAALLVAEVGSGLVGTVLLVLFGLGFVAAGPVAAQQATATILNPLE